MNNQLAWPYDWQHAQETLRPNIIRDQGDYLLNRALNMRNIIAFLGTGVSSAYGRVSWAELAESHTRELKEWWKGFEQDAARRPIMEMLFAMDARPLTGGEDSKRALQLGEQVWASSPKTARRGASSAKGSIRSLAEHVGLQSELIDEFENRYEQPELGKQLFRAWIKRETGDELAHVGRLLEPLKRYAFYNEPGMRPILMGAIPKPFLMSRETVGSAGRPYLLFFKTDFLRLFHDSLRGRDWRIVLAKSVIGTALGQAERGFLAPSHYFAVSLALDLAARSQGNHVRLNKSLAGGIREKRKVMNEEQRGNAISESADPLSQLARGLEISRFMTTNYDLEVERWFKDEGYSTAQPPSHRPESLLPPLHAYERYNSFGTRARDISLDDQSAIELIDFAANEAPYDLEVVHLHGRATRDNDLVVTERDYQLKYQLDRPAQRIMEEGLRIAFGGNPILFVGFNLSEGDVQRPLREFVARTSRRNRSLIGFRPAYEDKAKRDAATMDLYAQYGIHLIHYGFTARGAEAERKASIPAADNSWLYRVSTLLNDKLRKPLKNANVTKAAVRDTAKEFARGLSALRDELESDGCNFNNWCFESDGGPVDLRLEMGCLEAIAGALKGDALRLDRSELREHLESLFLPHIGRLYDSIFLAALSAKLQGQTLAWRVWWKDWRRIPDDRSATIDRWDRRLSGDLWDPRATHTYGRHIVREPSDLRIRVEPLQVLSQIAARRDEFAAERSELGFDGRRLIVLCGPRGIGMGVIFARLYEAKNFWIGPNAGPYRARFFANVGFSCEVASVWDSLIAFLCRHGVGGYYIPIDWREFERLGRLEKLEFLLSTMRVNVTNNRLLVVFTAFDVLFESGYPKNTEIRRALHLLLGPAGKDVPIDVMLLVREGNLPLYFKDHPVQGVPEERFEMSLQHRPTLFQMHVPNEVLQQEQFKGLERRLGDQGVSCREAALRLISRGNRTVADGRGWEILAYSIADTHHWHAGGTKRTARHSRTAQIPDCFWW